MKGKSKLLIIKLVHTLIWSFFVLAIFFVVYSGLFNQITIYTWIAIILVLLEGVVLLIFRRKCPLTLLARRFSDSKKDNFDIFLPEYLARYNTLIFTSIYFLGLVLIAYRILNS